MKKPESSKLTAAALLFVSMSTAGVAGAQSIETRLTGFEEVPAISTGAKGDFQVGINECDENLVYELSYQGLESEVLMAHIHLGQPGVNGGISVWLCTTPAAPLEAPEGTPVCPQEGTVTGTIDAAGVVGPTGQGIEPGELDELIKAIRARATYANVHTTTYPGGEIRGRIE